MQGDFRVGDWLVQPSLGRVSKAGAEVRLRAKVMDLLVVLAERPGEVVSKDALLNGVWGTEFVSESALTHVVTELRQALGDDVDHPQILETISKRGYRLIAPVEPPFGTPAPEAAQSPAPSSVAQGFSLALRHRRWLWAAALLIVLVVATLLALDVANLRQRVFDGGAQTIKSIAVLPLENLSGSPEQQPFVDGMHEALINTLGQIGALTVISRTSVMGYAPPEKRRLPEIARELHVQAIVEGTVAREGGRVRVSVQLIEAATDRLLWTKSYDRDLRDVLALQNDVASAIAAEINATLTTREQRRLATARPVNPEAYELLVKSRVLNDREAIEYLKRAIALAPDYADAYSALASTYYYAAVTGPLFSPSEGIPPAKAAALKALELDPEHSDAHAVLGDILFRYDWDYRGAERELREAIQLNPNGSRANSSLAFYLTPLGRVGEAIDAARRTLEVDPLYGDYTLGWVYLRGRLYVDAIEPLARAGRFRGDPHVWSLANLAMAYWMAQRRPEALEVCDRIAGRIEGDGNALISAAFCAYAYGSAGREADARALIGVMNRSAVNGYLEPTFMAIPHIALGERDEALAWLEKAYAQRSMSLVGIRQLPWFDSLRSDPRFQDLVHRLNLPGG